MTATDERVLDFPALKDALGKLDEKRNNLASILKEAGPTYDMSLVKSIQGDTQAKVEQIRAFNEEIDACKRKVDELREVGRAAMLAQESEAGDGPAEKGDDDRGRERKDRGRKSFADHLMAADAIKGYKPGANFGPSSHLDIDLKTLFQTSAGWDSEDTRGPRVEMFASRPSPHVVNYIPQTTTDKSTVLYMEETVFTNAAAEVAEGGTYPEATLQVEEKSSEVRKIAVFLPVTDEQFEDEPRARDYVNNRLPFMVRQRLDSQVLVGNGTSPNLRGTENVVGIQTQALGADPLTDALHKAIRKVREDGFAEPSAVFIRPSLFEGVRLLRTADGVYIWGHPAISGPTTIWGVPVIETTAAPATKALLGDYQNFSELAVRRGLDIQVSNSHGTYFIEGKLAVRCDVRVAMVHYRPKAFAAVTGLS